MWVWVVSCLGRRGTGEEERGGGGGGEGEGREFGKRDDIGPRWEGYDRNMESYLSTFWSLAANSQKLGMV